MGCEAKVEIFAFIKLRYQYNQKNKSNCNDN